jgi:outer membrane biosynthesis protein TonB
VSSTAKDFEEESISAVRHWTFHPGQKDGQPVSFKLQVEIEFKLYPDKPKVD